MKAPKVVSYIKVDGEWVNQNDLPQEYVREVVEKAIIRAASNIGFDAVRVERIEKTA